MKTTAKIFLISLCIYFLMWLLLYKTNINTLPIQSEDTLPAMFMPVTLLKEGTLYVDTYYPMLVNKYPHPDDRDFVKGLVPFYLKATEMRIYLETGSEVTSHFNYLTAFTFIPGLLSTPIYALPLFFGIQITWENLIILSHLSASTIMAFTASFFYVLLFKYFNLNQKKSIILTSAFAFGTINFAMLSQALWQHGIVELFTILALIYLFKAFYKNTIINLFISGLFVGIAILTRPTALLIWPLFVVLILFQYKNNIKSAFLYIFAFILSLIPTGLFYIFQNSFYGGIQNTGYAKQLFVGWQGRWVEGQLGMWLSPSKGILIYSPFVIFAFVGLYLVIKELRQTKNWEVNFKYIIFFIIILLHTLVLGRWKHWYGGFSFGYRMLSDVLPFIVLLVVPYMNSTLYEKTKKWFFASVVFSVLVQVHGMIFFDSIWHTAYDTGFVDTKWLWSIKDSEFVFNIRRVLVKFGLLYKACEQCLPQK